MWVLDHMDDLDADFRVFYRIDDIEDMTGPRFLALAMRVFAYQGVMAARATAEQEARTPARAVQSTTSYGTEVRQVEGNRADVLAEPAFAGLVSWGSG